MRERIVICFPLHPREKCASHHASRNVGTPIVHGRKVFAFHRVLQCLSANYWRPYTHLRVTLAICNDLVDDKKAHRAREKNCAGETRWQRQMVILQIPKPSDTRISDGKTEAIIQLATFILIERRTNERSKNSHSMEKIVRLRIQCCDMFVQKRTTSAKWSKCTNQKSKWRNKRRNFGEMRRNRTEIGWTKSAEIERGVETSLRRLCVRFWNRATPKADKRGTEIASKNWHLSRFQMVWCENQDKFNILVKCMRMAATGCCSTMCASIWLNSAFACAQLPIASSVVNWHASALN